MLVFSSALMMWSSGPRRRPCHSPAWRSGITPAFSANRGSRGKIQCSYRQGLIASPSRIRQTVLRLIGFPRAEWARVVRSSNDWRLRGNFVSATVSQAIALTMASSRGGKIGRAAPSRSILQSEVAFGPAFPPETDGVGMQLHAARRRGIREEWMLMQQEDQAGSLSELEPDRASAQNDLGLSQEIRRKVRAEEWLRTRHGTRPVTGAIVMSTQGPRSLPRRIGKPYSYF